MIKKLQAMIAEYHLTAQDADPDELAVLIMDECPDYDSFQHAAMLEQLIGLLNGE